MHQLILLRHAKAAAQAPGGSDHDRALTEAGRNAATAVGKAMRLAGLAPDVVLISTAARTNQTFQALEEAGVWSEWPNTDLLPALYMATPTQMRDMLRALPETVRSALVIGHNPALHELAISLSGPISTRPELTCINNAYPTAALAEFLITTPWRQLGPGGASLLRFLQPSDLR